MIERQKTRANNIVLALLVLYSLGGALAYLIFGKGQYIQVKIIAVIGLLFLALGMVSIDWKSIKKGRIKEKWHRNLPHMISLCIIRPMILQMKSL